jgi:uncharacterized protein YceK
MKNKVITIAMAAMLSGCSTISSVTVLGHKHQPTKAGDVLVYTAKPADADCETVAIVSAVSRKSMQASIDRLKREAAKVGANGVILTQSCTRYGGSLGYAWGNATTYGNAYSANTYVNSTAIAIPVYYHCASGTAVIVQSR